VDGCNGLLQVVEPGTGDPEGDAAGCQGLDDVANGHLNSAERAFSWAAKRGGGSSLPTIVALVVETEFLATQGRRVTEEAVRLGEGTERIGHQRLQVLSTVSFQASVDSQIVQAATNRAAKYGSARSKALPDDGRVTEAGSMRNLRKDMYFGNQLPVASPLKRNRGRAAWHAPDEMVSITGLHVPSSSPGFDA
jgi:hypothetical protein